MFFVYISLENVRWSCIWCQFNNIVVQALFNMNTFDQNIINYKTAVLCEITQTIFSRLILSKALDDLRFLI